jgi:superfamily I DNA/RNA helicase
VDLAGSAVIRANSIYEELLEEAGRTTFTDLIAVAVRLVRRSELVRHMLSARYPRLYVDEYQDLSPGLHELVMSLCLAPGARVILFAVGGPDQSIYSFNGSRPELLRALAAEVPPISLRRNYRSGDRIIQHAHRALGDPTRHVLGTGDHGEVTAERRPGA